MNINKNAIIFIPDNSLEQTAISRTTHLAISAHQDDIEFMAYSPISECFGSNEKHFTAVVTSDGAGSPRKGIYGSRTDEEMKRIRMNEQKKAAVIGEYSALLLLGHTSSQIKDPDDTEIITEYTEILRAAKPKFVYIHNLADKHDTHVAAAVKAVSALRSLKADEQPEKVYGCEVWRGLDWLCDNEKVYLDCGNYPSLARSLSGVFDSQISGGKRYDLAVEGRRLANATFLESHNCDNFSALNYAMDLTPLILDKSIDIIEYVTDYIKRFEKDVKARIIKLLGGPK